MAAEMAARAAPAGSGKGGASEVRSLSGAAKRGWGGGGGVDRDEGERSLPDLRRSSRRGFLRGWRRRPRRRIRRSCRSRSHPYRAGTPLGTRWRHRRHRWRQRCLRAWRGFCARRHQRHRRLSSGRTRAHGEKKPRQLKGKRDYSHR